MEVTSIYSSSHRHAIITSATPSQVLCDETPVTADTHPDIIKNGEVGLSTIVRLTVVGVAMSTILGVVRY